MTHVNPNEPGDLRTRTVRTVAILVGSCVLFVGALSVAAVAITNRAVGSTARQGAAETTETAKPPATNKTSAKPPPQSI